MNITKSPFSLSFSSPACPHRFLLYPSFSSRLVPSASSVCSSLSALQATPCRETDESVREIERYIMHTKKNKNTTTTESHMSFRFHLLLSLLRFSEDFLLKWCAVRDADVLLDLPSDSALLCLFPDFSVMFSNLVEGGEKKDQSCQNWTQMDVWWSYRP